MDKVSVDGAIFISARRKLRDGSATGAPPAVCARETDSEAAGVIPNWKQTPGAGGIRIMMTKRHGVIQPTPASTVFFAPPFGRIPGQRAVLGQCGSGHGADRSPFRDAIHHPYGSPAAAHAACAAKALGRPAEGARVSTAPERRIGLAMFLGFAIGLLTWSVDSERVRLAAGVGAVGIGLFFLFYGYLKTAGREKYRPLPDQFMKDLLLCLESVFERQPEFRLEYPSSHRFEDNRMRQLRRDIMTALSWVASRNSFGQCRHHIAGCRRCNESWPSERRNANSRIAKCPGVADHHASLS